MTDNLLSTLAAAGINTERLPTHLAIGKFYRLPAIGKAPSDKSCYVKMLAQGVAVFGNWSTGEKGTCFADKPTDKAELERWEKEAKAAQAKAYREQVKVWDEAAIRARRCWFDLCIEADFNHLYLQKKRLKPYGLRQYQNSLVVPVYSITDNKTQSLQFIEANSDKRFLTGGKMQGGYFAARQYKDGEPIILSEGWATSQSLAQQWHIDGWHVCAFNAGNLINVAKAMRQRHPKAEIILAVDNDLSGAGQQAAKDAAKAVKARLFMPEFTDDERQRFGKVSDWNDRYLIDLRTNAIKREVKHYVD